MTQLTFDATGESGFKVTGRLGFDTVHTIWEPSRAALTLAAEPSVDLGGVTYVDSAGLALVLDWVGQARARGQQLHLTRVPGKLMDLARISEVDEFLGDAAPAGA